jgi:hypothetical protein
MTPSELAQIFDPILADVAKRSVVADSFVDRNLYRLYIATLWANVVLNPEDAGLTEDDLEDLHEVINTRIAAVLGSDEAITSCFSFVNSREGETAMREVRLTQNHKDLLLYFSSMILDPNGHRRWIESIEQDPSR